MANRPDPMTCPECGSPQFILRRKITVWQRLFVAEVDAKGDYVLVDEDLGDTAEEHALDSAECRECATPIPTAVLLPWTEGESQ